MNKISVKNKKLFISFSAALVLTLVSFFVYTLWTGKISFGAVEDGWDGNTIATTFSSGNGSLENPYVIKTPEEFVYFKQLIEGDNYKTYQDKYYSLDSDINLNNKSLSGIGVLIEDQERYFKGHFNGNGHHITNVKIDKPIIVEDIEYYSLFTKVMDAYISNLNIDGYSVSGVDNSKEVISSVFGDVLVSDLESKEDLSIINNISISGLNIDNSKIASTNSISIFNNISEKSKVQNIYIKGEYKDSEITKNYLVFDDSKGDISNFVIDIKNKEFNNKNINNYYYIVDGVIYLDGKTIEKDKLLNVLNDSIDSSYYWDFDNNSFVIKEYVKEVTNSDSSDVAISRNFSFSIQGAPNIVLHDTGKSGESVYINDLVADYNYYMGLNYTTSSDGSIPTGQSRGIYNSSNLAKVYMAYEGYSINDSNENEKGYVSLGEQYSEFIYYKYYPIDNGYVNVPLIDNPYADRPNNKAFNGWVTDYPGAVVSYDSSTYTRYVKIPASETITIAMYASWTEATTVNASVNNNGDLNTGNLKSIGMYPTVTRVALYDGINFPNLYSQHTISSGTRPAGVSYPTGAVDNRGRSLNGSSCTPNSSGGWWPTYTAVNCTYYMSVNTNNLDFSLSYYYMPNGTMVPYTMPAPTGYRIDSDIFDEGDNASGFFKKRTLTNGQSYAGLYNSNGVYQSSGTCSGNCTYYELLQYSDQNVVSADNYEFYYLATRDTNIAFVNESIDGFSNDKPVTVTGINNGTNRSTNYIYLNNSNSISAEADLRIEYVQLYSNQYSKGTSSPTGSSSNYVYGNFYNLKIGRGLYKRTSNNNREYFNAVAVLAGSDSAVGSSSSPKKYHLIVESGYYNYMSGVSSSSASGSYYLDGMATYGCDFDRVPTIDNDNLEIYYTIAATWGGNIYSKNNTSNFMNAVVKSGTIGEATSDAASGIYVGGLNSGAIYAPASLIVEGGKILNINGGPLVSSSVSSKNIIYINFKGGEADFIFGGAARSLTHGNRIINVTGGTVNGSVFGGSNGYDGNNSSDTYRGTLNGDTFVYVGGNATVGAGTTRFGSEAGSVFGAGNGNSNYDTIGAVNNSKVMIDSSATVNGNVYGGGNFGSVTHQTNNSTSTTKIFVNGGDIKGSVYGAGNNNGSGIYDTRNRKYVDAQIEIQVNSGTIESSVYGGSRTEGTVYGTTSVAVNGGTINADVYGGGEGGYTNTNNPGTYVRDDVAVTVNNGTVKGNVYGGSAYGSVNTTSQNATSSTATTTVTVNNGTVQQSVFGGGKGGNDYTPQVAGDITVTVNGGSLGKVFGGFDASGKPTSGDVVYLKGGTIGDAFGGGNNANQDVTDIRLQGAQINGNLYGGSNLLGTVTTSNVTVTSGSVTDIYGGNNLDGLTITTNVNVSGGTVNGDIYGGGNEAPSGTSNVTISGLHVNDVYGGGKKAGVTETNVTINGCTLNKVFGGSNVSGNVGESNVHVNNSTLVAAYGGNNQGGSTTDTNLDTTGSTITNVFGGGDNASSGTSTILVNSGNITNVYGGGNEAGLTTSTITISNGTITNVFGGSNTSGDLTTSNVVVGDTNSTNINITNVYGGNNKGGITSSTNVTLNTGTITNVYGGGNEAVVGATNVVVGQVNCTDVYGGGNAAGVTGNTSLDINDASVSNNIYGGGNEGVVNGNTNVTVTGAHINGNAFAGGNGSTAVVHGNSTITIDGDTEIGTATSTAPNDGCVFGSGNAANTGIEGVDTSKATVNIVGGTIHGNVYGGPKMAVVYGTTKTNIGTSAVNILGLVEDDIVISGTVFGGGESNASGSETYDWTFISVTQGIDVLIDGTGYINHNHDFIINGSIFGSGNASSSAGSSNIYIKNLGSREHPNKSISIQRANELIIDSSVIELEGTTDRTNEYSDILYSFNIIDKLTIKNNTVLLLQHNANLLKELYSGVDSGNTVVKATVDIDEENQTVTKNVDNRIYMLPGQNLNVTINQAATAYGRVSGMTFFGMYNGYENGTYRYGLYDDDLDYGDSGDASLEIVGGSYVIGLRNVNHDITKDGFYSNYLNDEYTEVKVDYIDPSPIGETGYRWIIGFEAINYEFTLNASKYSSLGTYELQLIDFADGNTAFNVIGFDASGLNPNINLIDSTLVPRIGRTETEANSILGLSMKAETQEWTGYGTTKMLNENGGKTTGDKDYKTDSRKIPPSLMFYLYHAKNINSEGPLGTVILTLRAEIPKNAIDYDIKFITVTINLVAKKYEDNDSYDASITYDKRYEMPSSTSVNITNQSQFSTYYSLIAWNDNFASVYGNNNSNYHVLVTNNPLPLNTMITMLDYGYNDRRPEYYYFKVNQTVYDDSLQQLAQYNEVTYRLSDFIKMNSTSTNNKYSDSDANLHYYDSDSGLVDEEFMFIFDFKETNVSGEHLDNTMLFELRNHEDRTMFSVLGIRESLMVYNTYESSNVVLSQNITNTDNYLYYNIPDEFNYSTVIQYNQTENRQSVIDTNYESSNMGLNVVFYDKEGIPVSSSLLIGTSIIIDNQEYFADGDGVFRIKLANKVSNLNKAPKLTVNKDLPSGEYTIRYTLFASDDGLHNSESENSVMQEFTVYVVSSENSITVDCEDLVKIVDGETGLNMKGTNTNTYTVKYSSQLNNPNFRVEVLKRNIDDINSTGFTSIPFNNLFTNRFTHIPGGNEVYINMGEATTKSFDFYLNDELTSGTYKIVFKLYDNDQLIDDDVKYVIVNKKSE